MKTLTVRDPLPSEKLLDVFPRPVPFLPDPTRPARPNLFPGRHLSAATLDLGMDCLLRPLLARGRAVEPGILAGLELTWSGGDQLGIAPGRGLFKDGTDLSLSHELTLDCKELPVVQNGDPDTTLDFARKLKKSTDGFVAALVLRPGFVRQTYEAPGAGPRPESSAFTALQPEAEDKAFRTTLETDAVQVLLVPYEDKGAAPGPAWRNRAAYAVFAAEGARATLPWSDIGVPLALIAFNQEGSIAWVDRHAVARKGGRPRRRVLLDTALPAYLGDARFDQFLDQLGTDQLDALAFEKLPPVGLLPKAALQLFRNAPDIPTGTPPENLAALHNNPRLWAYSQAFLGPQFSISITVAPLSQMDALIRRTRTLEPFDVSEGGTLALVLPVAEAWYEPDLLRLEFPDAVFYSSIRNLLARLNTTLGRRLDLRRRQTPLELSISGAATEFPADDASLVDREEAPVLTTSEPALAKADSFGVTRTGLNLAQATYAVNALAQFKQFLQTKCSRFWTQTFEPFVTDANGTALSKFIASLNLNSANADDGRLIQAFVKAQEDAAAPEQDFFQQLDKLAVGSPNLLALSGFLDKLEARVNRADQLVDAGFLKVNTDVYRLGQLINGQSLDSSFAVSPSLNRLLQRPTQLASPDKLTRFTGRLAANMAPSTIDKIQATTAEEAGPQNGTTTPRTLLVRATNLQGMKTRALRWNPESVSIKGDISDMKAKSNSLGETLKILAQPPTQDPVQLKAYQDLKADFATLNAMVTDFSKSGKLQAVEAVSKFATNYVEGFQDLTPKQLRSLPLDRLKPPLAPQLHEELHQTRQQILEKLSQLDLPLGGLLTDFVDAPRHNTSLRTRLPFHDLLTRMSRTPDITGEDDADEARYFSQGVRYSDIAISAMRAVETRIAEYREVIAEGRRVLETLRRCLEGLKSESSRVEGDIKELRHELATARALLAEEQNRLSAINERRRSVLAEHVDFIVFHRPIAFRPLENAPVREVHDGIVDDPIPECLKEALPLPDELAGLREVLRGAPADWLRHHRTWLTGLGSLQVLRAYLLRVYGTPLRYSPDENLLPAQGRYGQSLRRLYRANSDRFGLGLQPLPSRVDERQSWSELLHLACTTVSLGQLLGFAPADLARQASEQIDRIFRVAACLHRDFCQVPPVTRLSWAELYSEYDGPVNLRDLGVLDGWGGLDFPLRHRMQTEVDWLFAQVNASESGALAFVNDLVRICLLLASHSPVDQLLAAETMEAFRPVAGGLIRLRMDPSRVRIGMLALANASQGGFFRAVVQDIGPDHAVARVLEASDPTLLVRERTRIRMVDSSLS